MNLPIKSITASESDTSRDINVELPSVEGLLAGTLALMTGYAQKTVSTAGDAQAELMAKKIASNLFFLKTHPCLSVPFAAVLGNLQQLWLDLGKAQHTQRAQASSMWHNAAVAVQ